MKTEFNNAVIALRTAFKTALDDPNFDDNTLAEVWRHFLGMQAIARKLPEDQQKFNITKTELGDHIQFNFTASGLDEHPYDDYIKSDVVTFS
ncbi:MAG: hypothetical protein ACO23V_11170 [Chitinophagaceae bacterium]